MVNRWIEAKPVAEGEAVMPLDPSDQRDSPSLAAAGRFRLWRSWLHQLGPYTARSMDPTHEHKTEWEGWPFTSMDEVADFASYMVEQIRKVTESTEVSISVTYDDKEFKHLTLAEFKEQASALPLDPVVNLSICAGEFERDAVIAWLFLFRLGMKENRRRRQGATILPLRRGGDDGSQLVDGDDRGWDRRAGHHHDHLARN